MGRILGVTLLALVALAGAVWLAMRVPDIPFATLEAAYTSPTSQFVTLENGARVHFRDEGQPDGHPIVLVHGFSASLHTWEGWVGALGDDYRLISLDLPGHGLSRQFALEAVGTSGFVATIDAVADVTGLDRFTLAGSSMGGHAAWAYAVSRPERTDGLVLVGAAGWIETEDEAASTPLVFRALQVGIIRHLIKDLDLRPMIRRGLIGSFHDQSHIYTAMVDRYAALSRAPGHRAAIMHLLSGNAERLDATEALMADIETPTLVLHGRQDKLVPVSNGERFGSTISDAELIIYEETGHLPQEERTAESAADVDDFLTRKVLVSSVSAIAAQATGGAVVVEDLNSP